MLNDDKKTNVEKLFSLFESDSQQHIKIIINEIIIDNQIVSDILKKIAPKLKLGDINFSNVTLEKIVNWANLPYKLTSFFNTRDLGSITREALKELGVKISADQITQEAIRSAISPTTSSQRKHDV